MKAGDHCFLMYPHNKTEFFENLNKLSEKEARRHAKLQMCDFHEIFEKKIKRFKPDEFIPNIIRFFRNYPPDKILPPHIILNTIEASCAYYKSGYHENFDHSKLVDILNFQIDTPFIYETFIISYKLPLFTQYMHRSQLLLQKTECAPKHLARYWKLFWDNNFTSCLFDDFQGKYGLSVRQWFECGYSAFSILRNDVTSKKVITIPPSISLKPEDYLRFIDLSTYSKIEIKERFYKTRDVTNKEFHFLIISPFLERPILELDNGLITAPIPELIFRHLGYGLLDKFSELEPNGYCIGKSFQNYCQQVIGCLETNHNLYDDNVLKEITEETGECDFLLTTNDENILIECKAVTFKATVLAESVLKGMGSTTQISKGLSQVVNTGKYLKKNGFDSLNIKRDIPFLAIIVTLGEIPEVNHEWYIRNIILKNPKSKKIKYDVFNGTDKIFTHPPIFLSVNSLENLIIYCNSTGKTFFEIYDEKIKLGYHQTGDWEQYLQYLIHRDSKCHSLQFVSNVMNEFHKFFEKAGE
ncbi:MAG: hypothetical protein JW912_00470 [Sedimentisphaerales bacterium]|nr:hypothetical protein [Sedimentisphaerales bacterium]